MFGKTVSLLLDFFRSTDTLFVCFQVSTAAAASGEPGVQIGGAVYYQSPAREGATYYPPPQPGVGTTPPAQKSGPVYYNTQAQSGSPSAAKPRVKNVIPIVKPEVCLTPVTVNALKVVSSE